MSAVTVPELARPAAVVEAAEHAAAPYMNPYLAGVGLGLVLLSGFVVMGRGLGASGAFSAGTAWALHAVAPAHDARATSSWASTSATAARTRSRPGWCSRCWAPSWARSSRACWPGACASPSRRVRGPPPAARLVGAFAGGALMACGAHLARGCTSGQALTGGALLNAGSWAFMMCVFGGRLRGGPSHAVAVAMSAPLYKFGLFGEEASLLVAFLIGIGFGFLLERAGFGSARKLVSQFYLNDLAVFKVMFTAIVTAMLGLTYLGWLGWLDLRLVYLVPTWLWPQIVGGLLLGVGFVVGGYCPGTSVAAIATGKLDGLVYVLGIFGGTLAFAFAFPLLKAFFLSGAYGALTLPQVLHLPYGVVVFAVVLMAVGGFAGAEWVEQRFGARS